MPTEVKRGDVWLGHLGQTEGKEQGGKRPLLIVSTNLFNRAPTNLVIVLPITTRRWPVRSHVEIYAPEGGLDQDSYIMCDQVRTATKGRLFKHFGAIQPETLHQVENRLRILLDL